MLRIFDASLGESTPVKQLKPTMCNPHGGIKSTMNRREALNTSRLIDIAYGNSIPTHTDNNHSDAVYIIDKATHWGRLHT